MKFKMKKSAKNALTGDQQKSVAMHGQIALVYGYNELARRAETLGEKAYYRLARDHAASRVRALGGTMTVTDDAPVLVTLDVGPPFVEFREKDVELMREAVKKFDEAKVAPINE